MCNYSWTVSTHRVPYLGDVLSKDKMASTSVGTMSLDGTASMTTILGTMLLSRKKTTSTSQLHEVLILDSVQYGGREFL